jgi:hypothetical protein
MARSAVTSGSAWNQRRDRRGGDRFVYAERLRTYTTNPFVAGRSPPRAKHDVAVVIEGVPSQRG